MEEKSKKAKEMAGKAGAAGAAQLLEFLDFMKKFGIIGLALATIIGGQVTALTKSLTDNIFAPLLKIIANLFLSLIEKITGQAINLNDLNKYFFGLDLAKFLSDCGMFALVMFITYLGIKYFVAHFLTEDEKKALKI